MKRKRCLKLVKDFATAELKKKEGDASQENFEIKNYVICPPPRRTLRYPFKSMINLKKKLDWTQLLIEHTSSESIQYLP